MLNVLQRSLALTATAAMATAGLAAFAPTATAATSKISFTCSTPVGDQQFPTIADTDLPATVTFGSTTKVKVTADVTLPDSVRNLIYGVLAGRSVKGTSVVKNTVDGVAVADANATIPSTALPASGDLLLKASGTGPDFVANKIGPQAVKVVSYGAVLNFLKEDGSSAIDVTTNCVPAAGADLTVDTVTVVQATSTTVLSVVGNQATATVSTDGGAAAGTVNFAVGGKTVSGTVTGGKATVTLPELTVGTYPVTASFVPTNAAGYKASSATGSYTGTVPTAPPTTAPPTTAPPTTAPPTTAPPTTAPPTTAPPTTAPPTTAPPTTAPPTTAPPTTAPTNPANDFFAKIVAALKKLTCLIFKKC